MTLSGDVVVVGGGAVGSACAWALTQAGARVTVVQRGDPGEGWRASAGMLAAQIESAPEDPLFPLGLAGRAFYARAAEPLREATGIDIGRVQCGVVQVARTLAEVEEFKAKVARQRQQALKADWLEPDEVAHTWPWLAPSLGAFWSPEDGMLDPARLVEAFRLDAVAKGARIVADTAVALDRSGDALRGVIGEKDRYPAPTVVVAGGAWAGRLGQLPRPLSVEPVRGQMAAFHLPDGIPPMIIFGQHCYLLRREDELLAGSTMEHAGFDPTTTAGGMSAMLARATSLYPPLAGLAPTRQWAGLRPGTPDGLPIVGPEPRLPGLWYATGHGRNGILLAGITGEYIARGVGGEPIGDELRAVRPTRFWNW